MLENHTPFAAERVWVRDINGAEVWVVAVKGTFIINPDGSTALSEEQEDICRVPKYRGEPGNSSLLYESDLVHTKPTTDILIHGHAYAPQGRRATHVDVTMKVANIVKTLRVFGDRYWDRGPTDLKITNPEPFEKIPITYERAFGGVDQKSNNPSQGWEPRNPVGIGFATAPERLIGQKAPNVEDPEALITSWEQRPRPAGFGPIAGHWSPRVELAGTYDEKWRKERLPLLPEDFNERFYLCAPEDQQAQGYLKGEEPVELHNFTPEGRMNFVLPWVVLGFETRFYTGEVITHRGTVHSVILEPDVPRVLMVWHTLLPCHHKVQKLQKTTIREKGILRFGQGEENTVGLKEKNP
jgi:hypothetical protein